VDTVAAVAWKHRWFKRASTAAATFAISFRQVKDKNMDDRPTTPTAKRLTNTVLALVFGAYYTFLGDITAILPFTDPWPSWQKALLRVLLGLIVTAAVFAFLAVRSRPRKLTTADLGLIGSTTSWYPRGRNERLNVARERIERFTRDDAWPLSLASVSGEWDMTLPLTAQEWRLLIHLLPEHKRTIRALLAHPHSASLERRCKLEPGQDFATMQRRILQCTKHLSGLSIPSVTVRWSLRPIQFHLLAAQNIAFFSPFADSLPGHDSPALCARSGSPWHEAFAKWFDAEWDSALLASGELPWIERGIHRRKAVFLDRDDTLINNVSYFDDPESVFIGILPERLDALRRLDRAGYRLIVVSNQHPVGLGVVPPVSLARATQRMKNAFRDGGVLFDRISYCTHNEKDLCNCRKPKPGLFEAAIRDFSLIPEQCHFIGDSAADGGLRQSMPQIHTHILIENGSFKDICDRILESRDRTSEAS
jgi:histidinol-phosphate phosphatase family protein